MAVHHHPDLYGSDLMLLRTLEGFRDTGHDVTLLVPDKGPLLDRADRAGITYQVLRYPQLSKSLMRPLALVRLVAALPVDILRLAAHIRRLAPDVIYVNTLTMPHWPLAARLCRRPVVVHVRELESEVGRLVSRLLTGQLLVASSIVANSRATAEYISGDWSALKVRTRVVYNGLDLPELAPRIDRQGSHVVLKVVGRLSPRKGQDVAIRALAAIRELDVDGRLVLVGTVFPGYEWYERELRALAATLGVSEFVFFRGYTDRPWEEGADVVLVPSRLEPFGNVAAEALASGTPTVVTSVGGLPEIVQNDETGFVVPPEDDAAMCDAILRILERPHAARAVAAAGRAAVIERYSRARYTLEMAEVIGEIAETRGAIVDGGAASNG